MRHFVLWALLLSGCQTSPQYVRNLHPTAPEGYRHGYTSGRDSGYHAAGNPYYGPSKDVNRYIADRVYQVGWDDGFAACKGKYDSYR